MVSNSEQLRFGADPESAFEGSQGRGGWADADVDSEWDHDAGAQCSYLVSHTSFRLSSAGADVDFPVRPGILTALIKLFHEPKYLKDADKEASDPYYGLTEVDHDEQNAGYQAAYSRLAASEMAPVDPVAWVADPKAYLAQELVRLSKADPRVKSLLAAADPAVAGPFLQSLAGSGLVI